jgi:hypothetical protein
MFPLRIQDTIKSHMENVVILRSCTLTGDMSRVPKSKYINGFERRLEFHFFQTMQTLGVLYNE